MQSWVSLSDATPSQASEPQFGIPERAIRGPKVARSNMHTNGTVFPPQRGIGFGGVRVDSRGPRISHEPPSTVACPPCPVLRAPHTWAQPRRTTPPAMSVHLNLAYYSTRWVSGPVGPRPLWQALASLQQASGRSRHASGGLQRGPAKKPEGFSKKVASVSSQILCGLQWSARGQPQEGHRDTGRPGGSQGGTRPQTEVRAPRWGHAAARVNNDQASYQ